MGDPFTDMSPIGQWRTFTTVKNTKLLPQPTKILHSLFKPSRISRNSNT
jgi:hypothetical protein